MTTDRMTHMHTALDSATHSAGFAITDLRDALHHATATECLIILPLIQRAAELERDIKQLLGAIREDGVK